MILFCAALWGGVWVGDVGDVGHRAEFTLEPKTHRAAGPAYNTDTQTQTHAVHIYLMTINHNYKTNPQIHKLSSLFLFVWKAGLVVFMGCPPPPQDVSKPK